MPTTHPASPGLKHLPHWSAWRTNLRFELLLPALTAVGFLFIRLGTGRLADWDEAIYAELSKEMLRLHSWLVPHWNYQPWFEKPPLFLWTTAALFKLFGVSEFWARAASAISGVGVALVTYWYAKELGGRLRGWLAITILLTSFRFFTAARFGTTDVMLALGMFAGVYGIHRIAAGKLNGWYWFFGGLAVALLTKSAASAPLVLTLGVVWLKERWSVRALSREFFYGLLLFVIAVAPWHAYMLVRFGQSFADDYLGRHVLARSMMALEEHTEGPLFYAGVIVKGTFPWCLLLVPAALRAWRTGQLGIAGCYSCVLLIFYSAIRTKLFWYIVPIYPALAVIASGELEHFVSKALPQRSIPLAVAALLVLGLFICHIRDSRNQASERRPELELLVRAGLGPGNDLLLLGSDGIILDEPAILFYTSHPVRQVFFRRRPTRTRFGLMDSTNDARYRYPVPIAEGLAGAPRLIVLDRRLASEAAADVDLKTMLTDGDFVLATVSPKHR